MLAQQDRVKAEVLAEAFECHRGREEFGAGCGVEAPVSPSGKQERTTNSLDCDAQDTVASGLGRDQAAKGLLERFFRSQLATRISGTSASGQNRYSDECEQIASVYDPSCMSVHGVLTGSSSHARDDASVAFSPSCIVHVFL